MGMCNECAEEAIDYYECWLEAYPEDIFRPIRPNEADVSRERIAAHALRHMLKVMIKDAAALMCEATE